MVKQFFHQNALYVVVKKPRPVKNKEAGELWSILGIKTQLSKIPLLSNILI